MNPLTEKNTHSSRWWTLWSWWARLRCGLADGRSAGPDRRCVSRRPRGTAEQTGPWTAPDRCGTAPGTAGSGRGGSWGCWCCPSNSWSDAQPKGVKHTHTHRSWNSAESQWLWSKGDQNTSKGVNVLHRLHNKIISLNCI